MADSDDARPPRLSLRIMVCFCNPVAMTAIPFRSSSVRMPRRQYVQSVLAACLILAMLVAQWAGLQHRIEHADRAADVLRVANVSSGATGDAASAHVAHSCALFDAAALGDTLHNPPDAAPCLPALTAAVRHRVAPSDDVRFGSYYSSRAPPSH